MARHRTDGSTLKRGIKFAQLIRNAREARSLTQSDLALKAGISVDTVRSIETNKIKAPSVFVAIDLVTALGEKWPSWIKQLEVIR